MADVKINLEATHKEFLSSIQATSKAVIELLTQLNKMSAAHNQTGAAANKHAVAMNQSTQATTQHTRAIQQNNQSQNQFVISLNKTVAALFLVYEAGKTVGQGLASVFTAAIKNIDDFRKQTIGTAAAITNIRDETENMGQTWDQTFSKNLKATVGTFLELERLSARYFASAQDLQLAYNALAQRGIVIRKDELKLLAQTTDLILLLTQGQQSTIQVQEEIRSLINGTLRPTAQLGQLLKSYGKDIKDVAANIRAFQSLRPLEDILRGAALATNEIQKTFQATTNGLEVIIKQIGRVGGELFFERLVASVQRFTDFLTKNRSTIAGYFGVAGNIVAETINRFEKFLESLIGGNKAAGEGAPVFITLATSIQLVGIAMARLLELTALLLRDLPLAIAAFQDVFAEDTADKAVSQIDKIQQSLMKLVQASPLGVLIEQFAKLAKIDIKIPGMQGLENTMKVFGKLSDIIAADIKQVGGLSLKDLGAEFKKLLQQNVAAFNQAKGKADGLLTQGQGDTFAPTSRGFRASAEELAAQGKARNQLYEATLQFDRAARLAAQTLAASQVDLDLQSLRRDLALIDQGFIVSQGVVSGFRSTMNDLNEFLADNLAATTRGVATDFQALTREVTKTATSIGADRIVNLQNQLLTARAGLQNFIDDVKEKNAEIIADQTGPILASAAEIRAEANHAFQNIITEGQRLVSQAKADLAAAIATGNAKKVRDATNELSNAEALQRIGEREAKRGLAFAERTADLKEQTAEMLTQKVLSQQATQIATQENRIGAETLRIRQAINQEIGRAAQTLTKLDSQIVQFQQKTEALRPRTPLQAAQGEISAEAAQLAKEVGELKGNLGTLTAALQETWYEGGQSTVALKANIVALREEIRTREENIKATTDTARALTNLKTASEAVEGAVQRSSDILLDSLLQSFEGKKTNFLQAFKGVADSLFKDVMKDTIESLKTAASKAFQGLAESLPQSMQGVLGPAFLAGFALIASFVLGQLLSGDNSSASPGNASVGIQSTEQVRGLIGGETQIPIGLIGESLQDALVPTNLLLSRIAAGVDRLSFGGIDPAVIEQTISASISDALQIQLSAT